MNTLISINLPVHVIAESGGRRSELNLLRDALLFYADHLREQSNCQQNPDLLVDAANVDDMLENLTQQAFEALSERSQQLTTLQQ
jgi:hypothetical protein